VNAAVKSAKFPSHLDEQSVCLQILFEEYANGGLKFCEKSWWGRRIYTDRLLVLISERDNQRRQMKNSILSKFYFNRFP